MKHSKNVNRTTVINPPPPTMNLLMLFLELMFIKNRYEIHHTNELLNTIEKM